MYRVLLLILIALVLQVDVANAHEVKDLTGQWRTVRHGALVDIVDCGDGTPCGSLLWIDPEISEGNTQDIRNRDTALRERPLIGVPILWGFTRSKVGWDRGRLYNPDDGKIFRAYLRQQSDASLRVTGCLGPFCRSQLWVRAKKTTLSSIHTTSQQAGVNDHD